MNAPAWIALLVPFVIEYLQAPGQEAAAATEVADAVQGEEAPSRSGQQRQTPLISELVSIVLADIDKAIAAGDLELARGILKEVVADLDGLELGSDETRIVALLALDARGEMLGSLEELKILRRRLLEARTRFLPEDHPDLLASMRSVAWTKRHLGDLTGAHDLEEEVLDACKRLLPEDHAELLRAKQNLAATKFSLGELVGAHELFKEVLKARTRLLPEDHSDLLAAKHNLAATKLQLGELAGARDLEEDVLQAWALLLTEDHPDLLAAKQNLAAIKHTLGDLAGARQLQEEVLKAWKSLLPKDHPYLFGAKENLAATKHTLGDLAGARELQEEVLEARTLLLPEDHPDLLAAKLNLAETKARLGDLAGARKLEEQVLAARTQFLPEDHPDLLAAKQNLAMTKKKGLGDLAGARRLEEEVLEARTRLLPEHHPGLLQAKGNLAMTKALLGDLTGARELEEEVLEARTRFLPEYHPEILMAKLNHASTMHSLGDLASAFELCASLLEGIRANFRNLRADSPRAAREAARSGLHLLSAIQQFLNEAHNCEDPLDLAYFETLESLRAVSVVGPEVALAVAERPHLQAQYDRAATLRNEIARLAASAPQETEALEEWRRHLVELTQSRDSAEYELRRELSKAGVFVESIEAAAICRGLGEGELAVSFLRYPRRQARDLETGEEPPPVESLGAFFVRPGGSVERVELGPVAETEELVRVWRSSIGEPIDSRGLGPDEGEESRSPGDTLASGLALRRSILDPILERIGNELPGTLYLVLDDVLHLVPFDALPWDEDSYVGDRLQVRVEVSFQRLVAPPPVRKLARGLVTLGGVEYGETGSLPDKDGSKEVREDRSGLPTSFADAMTPPVSSRSGTLTTFLPLPAATEEIEAIGSRFNERFGIEPVLLRGRGATKGALTATARDARFLHIATHGWFAPDLLRSQLDDLVDAGSRSLFDRAEQTLRGFAPETLCGLALAGANKGRDSVGRVPGIITAEELSMLDLRGCELAVLSACETNVGIRRAGQGVLSLQAALHAAGARTAVTSLWKVDDAATRRLMGFFYEGMWSKGLAKAEALWRAKTARCATSVTPCATGRRGC